MMATNITKLHNQVLKKHLEEYSKWTFGKTSKAVTCVVVNSHQYSMDFRTVCFEALKLIEISEIQSNKFEVLIAGLKNHGGCPLYEHIMHEPIEKALIK